MKAKRFFSLLMAFGLTLLPMALSGCETEPANLTPSSSQAEAAEPTEAPTPEPTPEATPEPSPEPTAAPTPEPTPVGNLPFKPDFEEVFAENPIDTQMNDELDNAATYKAIYSAYNTAGESWRKMVEEMYASSFDYLNDIKQEALQEEQEKWQAEVTEKIQEIESECGDDEDGKIDAAAQIMELYRAKGHDLCRMYWGAFQEMPDFSTILSEAPMG